MKNMPNPYNFNMPVEPNMLFGRSKDLALLYKGLTAMPGDSFALIGGRRMGKTSILEALQREFEERSNETSILLVPVFMDLSGEGILSASEFLQTAILLAWEILSNSLTLEPINIPVDRAPAPFLERELLRWDKEVVNSLGKRLRIILLLDECEQIAESDWATELYSALRHLLVSQRTRSMLKVVMTGAHRFLARVRQAGSPLRNILQYHMLKVLDSGPLHELINVPVNGQISSLAAEAVAAESGGHPFLTQYIMYHLFENDIQTASTDLVSKIAGEYLHLRNDFQDWIEGMDVVVETVYRIVASTKTSLSEEQIQAQDPSVSSDIPRALDALCYHGLLKKDSDNYCIAGHMFYRWFQLTGRLQNYSHPQNNSTPSVTDKDSQTKKNILSQKLLVFLSHASEDKPTVRSLCKKLADDGFDPWLDEDRILPGQDWNLEIQKAMRASNAILLCFSELSAKKEGYIQREYKKAMSYQEEKPEGSIYVIPVRLDICEIPFSIRELQYVDYPSQYDRLVTALNVRANSR